MILSRETIKQMYEDKEINIAQMNKLLREFEEEVDEDDEEKKEEKKEEEPDKLTPLVDKLIASIEQQTQAINNRPITVQCNHGENKPNPVTVNVPKHKDVSWEFNVERDSSKFITKIIARPIK